MSKYVTVEEFESQVLNEESDEVVVYFSQNGCGKCMVVEAQLDNLSQSEGTNVVKVNISNTPELNSDTYIGSPIMSTPSCFLFEGGKLKEEYRGDGLSMKLVGELMSR